jgi:hypothetical protein
MLRACVVQGTQQVWVAALFFWGYKLSGSAGNLVPPWWVALVVWPLSIISFLFAYLMLYGLPEYYRQTPPKVPNFIKTLFRRRIVVWFLASEILRDYWLSGVRVVHSQRSFDAVLTRVFGSPMAATGASCGMSTSPSGRSRCSSLLSSSASGHCSSAF